MPIDVLRNKTPQQASDDVHSFRLRYVQDWTKWITAPPLLRSQLFGEILRKWQAVRPRKMRRLRTDTMATHVPPFLDDLLDQSAKPISMLGNLTVLTIAKRSPLQHQALCDLWQTFCRLPTEGTASCVGITKAILLLTDGRIAPAFDSRVRQELRIDPPSTCISWASTLEDVADDIIAFETVQGSLASAVPKRFAHLAYGRLYDMALGPR